MLGCAGCFDKLGLGRVLPVPDWAQATHQSRTDAGIAALYCGGDVECKRCPFVVSTKTVEGLPRDDNVEKSVMHMLMDIEVGLSAESLA